MLKKFNPPPSGPILTLNLLYLRMFSQVTAFLVNWFLRRFVKNFLDIHSHVIFWPPPPLWPHSSHKGSWFAKKTLSTLPALRQFIAFLAIGFKEGFYKIFSRYCYVKRWPQIVARPYLQGLWLEQTWIYPPCGCFHTSFWKKISKIY